MYVSIRRYKAKPSDDIKRTVSAGFLPLISKAPGFVGFYVFETGAGELASVSIFETKDGANESNKAAADWVKANIPALGTPEKTIGEVFAYKAVQPKKQLVYRTGGRSAPASTATASSGSWTCRPCLPTGRDTRAPEVARASPLAPAPADPSVRRSPERGRTSSPPARLRGRPS